MNSSSSGVATIRELPQPYINVSFALSGKQLPADHGYLLYSAIARATGSAGVSPAIGTASRPGSPARQPRWGGSSDRVNAGSAGILPASSGLHKTDWLAIELISGFPSGPGLITLSSSQNSKLGTRNSKLSLRIPADHYRDVLPLAGKRLDIGGHQIRLGLPVARSLEPAPSLYARVVTIKKFTEPDPFLEAVNRQLDSLGVKGRVELPRDVAQTVSLRSDNSELETQNSKPNAVPRYRRRIVTIHGKSVVGFSVAGSARHFAKILKSSSLTTNPQYYALTLFSHRTQSPIGISEIDSSHTIPHLSAQHLSVSAATPYISTSVSSTAHHLTPHMIFIDKESYSNIPCPTYDRHFQCWVCNGARTLKHNRGVQGSNRRAVAGYLMRRWDDLSYL